MGFCTGYMTVFKCYFQMFYLKYCPINCSFSGLGAIARDLTQTHSLLKYDGLIISK